MLRLIKRNRCRDAYQFLTILLGVEYAALLCNLAALSLAFRLGIRRRIVVRAAQRHVTPLGSQNTFVIEDDPPRDDEALSFIRDIIAPENQELLPSIDDTCHPQDVIPSTSKVLDSTNNNEESIVPRAVARASIIIG